MSDWRFRSEKVAVALRATATCVERRNLSREGSTVARRSTATTLRLRRWSSVAMGVLIFAGCQTSTSAPKLAPSFARFYLESAEDGAVTATLPQSGVKIPVADKPVLTEYDFTRVQPNQAEFGRGLRFQLTTAAAHDFQRLADANRSQRVVLFVDGKALGARRVAQAFDGGSLSIFVEVPDDSLAPLAERVGRTSQGLQKPVPR